MDIKGWFNEHPNIRMVVKGTVLGFVGAVLYIGSLYVASVPPEFAALYTAILSVLNEKYKLLNILEPWPIIGSKPPTKSTTKK